MPPKQSLTSNGTKEGQEKKAENNRRRKCSYCAKTYSSSHNLLAHVNEKHAKVAIRCKNYLCATYFHTKEERKKHNEEVHEKSREIRKHPCIICGEEFRKFTNCLRHVENVHKKPVLSCSVRGCCSYFMNTDDLKGHFEEKHKQNEELKPHKCDKCDYKTGKKCHLIAHIETMHGTGSHLECDNCKKKFSSKISLAHHVSEAHKKKKCRFCEQNVLWLNNHLSKKQCNRCKRDFECSGLLVDHKKERKDCKPPLHQCTKCLKVFSFKCRFERHTKRKTCKPFNPNTEQERQEATKEERSKHAGSTVQTEIQEETSNLIHCAHCSESFRSFKGLKLHLCSKHGLIEKTFECEPCEKKFLFLKNLIQHFRVAHMKTD